MKYSNKNLFYLSLVLILLAGFADYYFIRSSDSDGGTAIVQETERPEIKTITIGAISDDAVKQIKELQPTADFLAAKLSDNKTRFEGKVIVVNTVDNLTLLVKERKVDIFIHSPFTAILIANKTGAVPFLIGWRDGVGTYYSTFFVKKNSSINALSDFTGKTIAFPNVFSSSSYFLPKAYLILKGFKLNESAGTDQIRYILSGSDEDTVLYVIEGKADVGALSSLDFEELPESIRSQLKQVERTGDVPRHVVSYRADLDPVIVEKTRQMLLNIDKDPESIEIFKSQRTKKYNVMSKEEVSNISKMIEVLE